MEQAADHLEDPLEWEESILQATDLPRARLPPLGELARAYEAIAARHLDDLPGTGRVERSEADPTPALLVRGLIFARRTFLVGRHLARHLEGLRALGHVVERGAGLGPVLLALAPHAHGHLTAEERFPEFERPRRRLLAKLGRTEVRPSARSARRLIAYGYSFSEYAAGRPEGGARLLRRTLGEPETSVLIVEPGDRRHSELLRAVRDILADKGLHPSAPCAQRRRCPMGERPKDWCHFTLLARPTPLGAQIAAKADRDPHQLHFSFLFYQPKTETCPVPARVLERRPQGKSKLTVRICTETGLETLVALSRRSAAFEALQALEPVQALDFAEQLDRRGDGLRLDHPSQLALPAALRSID